MMPFAYPGPLDASQIQLAMPAPPPVGSKSYVLDILKLVVGLFIALALAAILVVLIFLPRTGNAVDLRESNEQIAKLQRESHENIARLEREQEAALENERQKRQNMLIEQQLRVEMQRIERQENLTEKHRLEDRLTEQQQREQDVQHAMEQSRLQREVEQKRYELLLEERQLAEQHRQEDLGRGNAELVSKFMEDIIFVQQPLNRAVVAAKVQSLLRRLDPLHKSLLIDNLYKANLLLVSNADNQSLDLRGANLKDLDLDGIDAQSGQIGPSQSYNHLALPSTNLINASFDQLYLDDADFSFSDMMGISFRSSRVLRGNFSHSLLSLSNFRNADVSQSHFAYSKIHRASFQNAKLFQIRMDNADIQSTDFQSVRAIEANFSGSEMSNTSFQYAELSYARMDYTSVRSANFYSAKAIGANFSNAYMPDCLFQWANLQEASFRFAVLLNADFENANVADVDFTRAFLPGARITRGQLDVALSITNATLPDGSMGKNKNLVKNGDAQCSDINGTISNWIADANVFTDGNPSNSDCVFQARTDNATLQQSIAIDRYNRLIQNGQGRVYIEMQVQTGAVINPPAYMIVRFLNAQNTEIAAEVSSMNMASSTPLPRFSATFPCPSNAGVLQVSIVFRQANTTVDNIYVTIE